MVLLVGLAVHASTFLGVDPMEVWPGVMFLHLTIFPPFIAAVYYASRAGGKGQPSPDPVAGTVPLWLQIMTGVFFAYAFVNFAAFIILNEGGSPHARDGKFVLSSHGKVLRELSEEEYHRHQAYVVRGASGHWMLFASGSLMFLVGAAKHRRRSAGAPPPDPPPRTGPDAPPAAPVDAAEPASEEPAPEPTTVRAGLLSLVLYVAGVAAVLSDLPALGVAAVPPVATAAVLALRRRRGFPHRTFESGIGCLTVIPNALLGSRLGYLAAEFVYLTAYAGLGDALNGHVKITFPREGPSQLSNGEPLDNRVWSALMLFIIFPMFVAGTVGLTYLAEHVGRLVEVRRHAETPRPRP
jgi:hypothetical protein